MALKVLFSDTGIGGFKVIFVAGTRRLQITLYLLISRAFGDTPAALVVGYLGSTGFSKDSLFFSKTEKFCEWLRPMYVLRLQLT